MQAADLFALLEVEDSLSRYKDQTPEDPEAPSRP